MRYHVRALFALVLSFLLAAVPAMEGFAEGAVETYVGETVGATAEPSEEPTAEPTEEATVEPSEEPTAEPSEEATAEPIEEPTAEPAEQETVEPSEEPLAVAVFSAEHPAFDLDRNDATMTAVIIGYDDTTEKAVVIPATSDGYAIVGIMASAFAGTAITSVTIADSVTSIGASAFTGCAALASVTFGSGLKTIGGSAFSGCTALTTISVPNSVTSVGDGAFMGCSSLASVAFGTGLREIGASAFQGCALLSSVTLGTGLTTIADSAFSGCAALDEIDLAYDALTYVGASSFAGCPLTENDFVYSIKNGEATLERYTGGATEVAIADVVGGKKLSTVAASAFLGKTAVTKVVIGPNVKKIGASAFAGLVKLAQVEMNAQVALIDASAFDGCAALAAVTLPDSLTIIGARAFADTAITSFNIPPYVSSLAASAFDGCPVAEIEVDAANTAYSAIDNLLFEVATRTLLRAYGDGTEITVPTSARVIGDSAFATRTKLKKVTLATTVTTIAASAFSGCTALEAVVIPDSVTSIADGAFKNCASLTVQVFSYSAYAYDYCRGRSIPVVVISVDVPPTAMTLSNMVIGVGNIAQIRPVFTPANATCNLTFASSNTSILAIAQDGRIKGKKIGKATVYVLTDNGILAKCVVKVKAAPSRVTLVAASATLGVGQTFGLDAELPNGTGGTISYITNNAAVATVSENGIVTAVGIGTCAVYATTYNNKVAKCKIAVVAAPTALTASTTTLSLGVGQKKSVVWSLDNGQNASALTFVSDNPAVANVSAAGAVTARKQGFATVTITSYNGLTATVGVIVLKAPGGMSVGSTSVTLFVQQGYEIPVKLTSGSAAGLTFTTSRSSVAKVSADGIITAMKTGSATITVKTHNGLKKSILVRVKSAPKKMTLNVSSGTLGVGDTFRLVPTFNSGAGAVMTYTSSDPSIASVDGDGDVVGLKAGNVTITAKTHNGLAKTCVLTICAAPASLAVALSELELGKGGSYTIVPVVKDTDGRDYPGRVFYKTSASGIATVTGRGKITAKNAGTVTITIYTYNGFEDTLRLTVKGAPQGISLNKTSGTLPLGANYQLIYTLKGSNAGGIVTFTSSNPFVCSVDETGYLTGVSAGTATITVTTYNGYKAKCYVTVR